MAIVHCDGGLFFDPINHLSLSSCKRSVSVVFHHFKYQLANLLLSGIITTDFLFSDFALFSILLVFVWKFNSTELALQVIITAFLSNFCQTDKVNGTPTELTCLSQKPHMLYAQIHTSAYM